MTSSPILIPDTIVDTPLPGLKPTRGRFDNGGVMGLLKEHYNEEQIKAMADHGVDDRMVFGINPYYQALVKGEEFKDPEGNIVLPKMPPSDPLAALVIPVLAEADDISGEKDPSNQIKYSPGSLKGRILHKYDEIVLGYTALACSAHCRYCYRLDLFNGSTGKGLVKPEELRDYVRDYNEPLKANEGCDPETGEPRYPIREILLSGGDPMVMTNKKLYAYMAAGAEGGVNSVRIGTKEMAFRPQRFDEQFAAMLRLFHENYPNVHVNIVAHFSHPDEMLLRDEQGHYLPQSSGYQWLEPVEKAARLMASLSFVSLENQTPIIRRVNDDAAALHLLHEELRRMNIKPKYIFQGREIEGHAAFSLPVEEAWRIHNESQKGLSDTSRSRFSMSTEWGKLEVVSVIDPVPAEMLHTIPEAFRALFAEGLVFMKSHRSPHSAETQGDMVIARGNPEALWISEYEDRIVYDGRKLGAEKYAALAQALTELATGEVSNKANRQAEVLEFAAG